MPESSGSGSVGELLHCISCLCHSAIGPALLLVFFWFIVTDALARVRQAEHKICEKSPDPSCNCTSTGLGRCGATGSLESLAQYSSWSGRIAVEAVEAVSRLYR